MIVLLLVLLCYATEEHHDHEHPVEHLFETFDISLDSTLDEEELHSFLESLSLSREHEHESGHDHEHEDEAHEEHEDEHESNNLTACSSPSEFLEVFDRDHSGSLNVTEFEALIPFSLVFVAEGACPAIVSAAPVTVVDEEESGCHPPSPGEKWAAGLIATVILLLVTWVGLLLFPMANSSCMGALIGLAAGALIGDSMLHLIPEALGAHSHGEESGLSYIAAGMLSCAGVLVMYLFEKFLSVAHSHDTAEEQQEDLSDESEYTPEEQQESTDTSSVIACTPVRDLEADEEDLKTKVSVASAYTLLFGGAIHNIVDGLLIGLSFSTDMGVGVATTVALLCHAIPHEMGDFAVLLNAGFEKWKALLLNSATSSTAMVGTIIGLAVGEAIQEGREVALALAAGAFLYLGMTAMLPLLRAEKDMVVAAAQTGALVVGVIIMLLISLYGEPSECGHDEHEDMSSTTASNDHAGHSH